MNYAVALARAHSRENADRILAHLLADRRRVPDLIRIFLGEEVTLVQRAAMVVGDLGRKKPNWLMPWQSALIGAAAHPLHPAVSRNVMRYFSELAPSCVVETAEGPLLDLAFTLSAAPQTPVGIRVFAWQVVANFALRYPELRSELLGIIALTLAEDASPGLQSRGRKIQHTLRIR